MTLARTARRRNISCAAAFSSSPDPVVRQIVDDAASNGRVGDDYPLKA